MHIELSTCCAHEGKTSFDKPAQVLTQKTEKVLHPVSNRSRTDTAFTGSPVQHTNHPSSFSSGATTIIIFIILLLLYYALSVFPCHRLLGLVERLTWDL